MSNLPGDPLLQLILRKSLDRFKHSVAKECIVGVARLYIEDTVRIVLPLGLGVVAVRLFDIAVEIGQVYVEALQEYRQGLGAAKNAQIDIDPYSGLAVVRTPDTSLGRISLPQVMVASYDDPMLKLDLNSLMLPLYFNHGLNRPETGSDLYSSLIQSPLPWTPLESPSLPCMFCGSSFHISSDCPKRLGFAASYSMGGSGLGTLKPPVASWLASAGNASPPFAGTSLLDSSQSSLSDSPLLSALDQPGFVGSQPVVNLSSFSSLAVQPHLGVTWSPPSSVSLPYSGTSRSVNPGCVAALAVGLFLALIAGFLVWVSHGAAPASMSAAQALRDYYALIEQGQYETAWTMLSGDFNNRVGITSLEMYKSEWNKSGPARIVSLDAAEENDQATLTVRLHYPKYNTYFNFRYELVRDPARGNPRFGHWLFVRGAAIK